jgi:hypothetical protein
MPVNIYENISAHKYLFDLKIKKIIIFVRLSHKMIRHLVREYESVILSSNITKCPCPCIVGQKHFRYRLTYRYQVLRQIQYFRYRDYMKLTYCGICENLW